VSSVFLKNTILGTTPLIGQISKTPCSIAHQLGKSMTGEYEWEDDATECLSHLLSVLSSPTGSGKQVIISAAAYTHTYHYGRRSLIAVPSLNLGNEYLKTKVYRKSGELVEYSIPPELDFRGTSDGYHSARKGTIKGLKSFLMGTAPAIAITTHQTLNLLWSTGGEDGAELSLDEKRVIFKNLWIAFDEAHHISGVLSDDEDISQEERDTLERTRTYLGDISNFICSEHLSLNSGMAPVSATLFRGDKVPLFYEKVKSQLSEFQYTRSYIDHWNYLKFKSFTQECIGYDDPIETFMSVVMPGHCSLVYLCPENRGYRRNDPEFVNRLVNVLQQEGYRVLNLIDKRFQEKNSKLLWQDNQNYKAGKPRSYDIILAVNMLREGTDYLPISHIYDLAPSNSLNRTVQAIGRMMRKDITPDGIIRKDEVSYTSFYSNLQKYNTEMEVRALVSDRVNRALSGMLGVFSLFGETHIPAFSDSMGSSTAHLNHQLEEVFGEFSTKAKEIVLRKILTSSSVDDAVYATVRELRQKVEGRPNWEGTLEEASTTLKDFLGFVVRGNKQFRYNNETSTLEPLEETGLLVEKIREAGFDITTIRKSVTTLFGADTDVSKLKLLKKTLDSITSTTSLMQEKDKIAAAYAFSPHDRDKTNRAKKVYNSRRNKFKKKFNGTALTPTVGDVTSR
jgi:superfamily II DNA or RNA helicase